MDELQQLETQLTERGLMDEYARVLVDVAAGSRERADYFDVFASAIELTRPPKMDCFDLVIQLTRLTVEQRCEAARKVLNG